MTNLGYLISREAAKALALDELHAEIERRDRDLRDQEKELQQRQESVRVARAQLHAYRDENVERKAVLQRQEESRREAARKLAQAQRSTVGATMPLGELDHDT